MTERRGGVGGWGAGLPKRFYERAEAARQQTPQEAPQEAQPETADGGADFTVLLDGRPLRCPGGSAFRAPRAVAEAAAAEWAAVEETIDPRAMPVTKAVNSALEQVAPQRAAVVSEIAGYGASDLVCYRAERPEALFEREAAAWDPLLDWLASRHGARLRTVRGIAPVAQPAEALAAIETAVAAQSDLGLTALSDLTALSGSVVIALGVSAGRLDAAAGWAASRIDEEWQVEQWGRDAEADAAAAEKFEAFAAAARLTALLRA